MVESTTAPQHGSSDTDEQLTRSKSIPEIRDAVAAHLDEMDGSSFVNRLLTNRARERLFSGADGRVLDVACGTGTNVEYVGDGDDYVGIDVSEAMLDRAADRFDHLERGTSLREMDAQDLGFDDDMFDTVITSMSTCMFPEPATALAEMNRVCKPDGQVLLLEHGRSSVGPLARIQDWRADARYEKMGCQWNQNPREIVAASPLAVREVRTGVFGTITAIEADPT